MSTHQNFTNFITNSSTKQLRKRINELTLKSKELKFLVGFFYFSGLKELYEGLKNNPDVRVKVLVGMEADYTNYGLVEYTRESDASDEEKFKQFLQSIKKSLSTELFDNRIFYEQVRFFIELIKEDRLIIRKTNKPNHAKLYIFKLEPSQFREKVFITGSSNLTYSGLTQEQEFNVEISDYGVDDAEKYFDKLWDNAVEITELPTNRKRLIFTLEEDTLIKQLSPFEAYALVLKSYLDTHKPKYVSEESMRVILERNGFKPYRYQMDAVKQALDIIERNNGVIIADVVGLGKTIIACLVARMLGKRGLVLCPPGLVGDRTQERSGWEWYLEAFGLYDWIVESIGKLDDEEYVRHLRSLKDVEVIMIDEAHRFRNEDTKSYEQLKNLCRDKIVILLTATPFNNRPGDILSLLKLFITPKKSTITLEENLDAKFSRFKSEFEKLSYITKYHSSGDTAKREKAKKYYESLFGSDEIDLRRVKRRVDYLAKQIRDVIEPVVIRRNRLDLQKNPFYKEEVKELTKVADPQEWFFELTSEQSQFYDEVIEYFYSPEEGGVFKGAIYKPLEYKEDINKDEFTLQQQKNLYDFMRRLLVKRFESSFGAFKRSIENFMEVYKRCLEFIKKTNKFVLDRSIIQKLWELEPEEIEEKLIEYSQKMEQGNKNFEIYNLDEFKKKEEFLKDIESDIELFEIILKKLNELNLVENDPKLKCLIEKVSQWLKEEPNRKIVIFSEYVDTIKYLAERFNNKVLVVAGNLSESKVREINENFDASYPKDKQRNDYDILLCTDRISEGFNLNRAGLLINYDIPWNPVRVIQRLGRINRIGKKVFDEVYIANFFPTEKGAELIRSREIASQKMFMIHNVLGEDSKIFDINEEPTPSELYRRIQQNPDELESESFYTKVLNEYEEIKRNHPEVIERTENCPPRVKVAKRFDRNELFVFIRKDRKFYIQIIDYENNAEPQIAVLEDIIDRIRCEKEEKPLELSSDFWEMYEKAKEIKEEKINQSEQSLERKAFNNIKTLLKSKELESFKDFLRALQEDIEEYGTLPEYTLRKIASIKPERAVEELKKLKDDLGEDYLQKLKEKQRALKREIIIAIENRRA